MKSVIKSFLLMIVFLTRIPLKYPYKYNDDDFLKGIKLTPLIGLIIGLFITIPFVLYSYLDKAVIVLIVWIMYVWITGGLHIDGFTDTIDGLFSNRDREKIFEIMSDSRIGAFGVIGFVFMVLFNVTLSYYVGYKFFILMPIIGRVSSLLAASISSYAKESMGMGTMYVENSGSKEVIIGNIFIIIVSLILNLQIRYLLPILLTQVVVVFLTNYIKKKIDGMTGDTIGFIVEISQTIYLFFVYIIIKII